MVRAVVDLLNLHYSLHGLAHVQGVLYYTNYVDSRVLDRQISLSVCLTVLLSTKHVMLKITESYTDGTYV